MNGLSDVRLTIQPQELQQRTIKTRLSAPPGLGFWGLLRHRWHTRRQLLELTADELRDIGITASQARAEGMKPFWRE